MAGKYDIDIRGRDAKVVSKFWFGPWHSIMHGVYTMDGKLLGLFGTYAQVLEFVFASRHCVLNMRSLLLMGLSAFFMNLKTRTGKIMALQSVLWSRVPLKTPKSQLFSHESVIRR